VNNGILSIIVLRLSFGMLILYIRTEYTCVLRYKDQTSLISNNEQY